MKTKPSRKEIEQNIKDTLDKNSTSKEVKKAKNLAMSKNIKLGNLRKKFCKKCYSLFNTKNSEIRIKKGFKVTKCKNCNNISRYRIK